MSEPDAVIHTEDLTKVYQGTDFAAVDQLNLDVQTGEIFGLLGPNGAGKTTTAGMLTTRVVPTSGRAFLGGVDVAAHPALAKQLSGIVSQQNTLDRQLTVWENLYFHGRLFGMGAKASRQTAAAASWTALGALLLRDLVVLRKHIWEFVLRTLIQPFLLCFVFLYVFPKIGQGIGGHGPVEQSAFATILVPGVVGISVMFQGVQSIALAMAQEFGFTREIEDRVQAPCPIWLVAIEKVLSGAAQGVLSAIIVLPIASVVHAPGVQAHLTLHWWIIVTFVPLACIAMAGLGLVLGTSFEPRNIGLMFGFIILPITFLGGTYYSWTKLAPVTVGGFPWLQTIVLINPLIYVNEGMRAAFTEAPHMHLYVIYPVVVAFAAVFLAIGLRNFRRRVLS
jgi:ABC-2 type transport system permease protein